MVIANQDPALKNLLKRENIRTMSKDLRKLREADAMREREKIKNSQQPIEEPLQQKYTQPPVKKDVSEAPKNIVIKEKIATPTPSVTPQSAVAPKQVTNPNPKILGPVKKVIQYPELKKYANEQEKQQIFLLESQRSGFEKQAAQITADYHLLDSKKKGLMLEKDQWQAKIDSLRQQQEEETQSGQEKDPLEKKSWSMETGLMTAKNNIISANEQILKLGVRIESLKSQIAKIDANLASIYTSLKKKEEVSKTDSLKPTAGDLPTPNQNKVHDKNNLPGHMQQVTALPHTPSKPSSNAKEDAQSAMKEPVKAVPLSSKPAFSNSPKAIVEKLEILQKEGEKQRMKFMEEVEAWAKNNSN